MTEEYGIQWRAECPKCAEAAQGPTDWAVEDWADSHMERTGHLVDVQQVGVRHD